MILEISLIRDLRRIIGFNCEKVEKVVDIDSNSIVFFSFKFKKFF